ncbi:MAG: beta-N-acetylhexosaminidase [Hyphomicrobiaceae bacterium]
MIVGLSAGELTPSEAEFLRSARPAGLIIFTRNAQSPVQLERLVGEARNAIGEDDCLVLVDQEGGRVQRLQPPHWRSLPPAASFAGRLAQDPDGARRAAELVAGLTAHDLRRVGINTNCVPCADRPVSGAHDIIGTRAYGGDTKVISELARIVAAAHMAGGVVPIVKHVPGHGRARVDSHLALPVVDTDADELSHTDFVPFRNLSDLPAAMTAHVVFSRIDDSAPATTSPTVVSDIIRSEIGFDGLLISDDISMQALRGPIDTRSKDALIAGCDVVLHCNGELAEMEAIAAAVPAMSGAAMRRFEACVAITRNAPYPLDFAEAEAALAAHMSFVA